MTPDEIRALGTKELEAISQGRVVDADLVALVLGGLIVDCLREATAQIAEIKDLLRELGK